MGTQLSTNYTLKVPFQIEVPQDVLVSHEGQSSENSVLLLPDLVEVVVSGPKSDIDLIRQRGLQGVLRYRVDTIQPLLEQGRGTVEPADHIPTADSIQVIKADPSEISLDFQRMATDAVRVVPGDLQGKPREGFRVGEIAIPSKKLVRVRGPERVLEESKAQAATGARPYSTKPIQLTDSEDKPFELWLPITCPPGVVPVREEEVLVSVEILPELIERMVEFPVKIVRTNPSETGEDALPIEPHPYLIRVREGGWLRRLKLRGSKRALDDIDDTLDKVRLGQTPLRPPPMAFVTDLPANLADNTPSQGQDENLSIEILGLPEGVVYRGDAKLPVSFVPK